MSEDHQWRQLGSIVNKVLMDAQLKAVRQGKRSKVTPRLTSPKILAGLTGRKLGHGFLNPDYQADAPAQLELQFGIAACSDFKTPHAPRGVRHT